MRGPHEIFCYHCLSIKFGGANLFLCRTNSSTIGSIALIRDAAADKEAEREQS